MDAISKLFFKQVRNLTLRNADKTAFLEWPRYKKKINFLDDFLFQQETRKQSVRNINTS
jgi:hypothetical protein